jgi:hypothetical protein
VDDEERTRRRLIEERRRLDMSTKRYDPRIYVADDEDDEYQHSQAYPPPGGASAAAAATKDTEEYDSGYAATSPGPSRMTFHGAGDASEPATSPPASAQSHLPQHVHKGILSPELPSSYASNAKSTARVASASQYKEYPRHLPLSTTSGRGYLVDREEHARQLLFPDTPPPPRDPGSTSRHVSMANGGTHSRRQSLEPPLAPFNPAVDGGVAAGSGHKPKPRRTDSLGSAEMFRRVPSAARGDAASKQGSMVFDPQEYGYLPSRWANGDHELRLGEQAREKYRPREWQPTHSTKTTDFT